jgi:hypothetical protein
MNIEICQPEIEALIMQRMELGGFHDVEEVLLDALKSAPLPKLSPKPTGTGADIIAAMQAMPYKDIELEPSRNRSLEQIFALVRGLADDVDFSRDPSTGRAVDLS